MQRKNTIIFIISVLIFLKIDVAYSKVVLPEIFGDNMVLQQKTVAAIWGTAKANAQLSLTTSWNNKKYTTQVAANGAWKLAVNTPVAGGPFEISITDGDRLVLKDVLIGEVWVCSGQSNMEMPLRGNSSPILNASEIILNADNENLRLFRVGRAASAEPISELKGQWHEATSATARDFSALAFQYGQILQKKLKVPVGIILSVTGGTTIETWMSKTSLSAFPEVKLPVDSIKLVKEPTVLFNGMIAPIAGYTIKGFLWFQGESNRHNPDLYERLFPVMVSDWRKLWNLGDIPFYYVQIAPHNGQDKTRSNRRLREVQLNSQKVIPNSGMIVALDVGMENDIHFMDKTTLAQRASYWALGHTYGIDGITYLAPEFKKMDIQDNKAILTFDHAAYLTSYKKPLTLFEIAGADKQFYPATATIKNNQVILYSEKVRIPIAVRYAYKEYVKAELYNNDGLPSSSFRTDHW